MTNPGHVSLPSPLRARRQGAAAIGRFATAFLLVLWMMSAFAWGAVPGTPTKAGRFIDGIGHKVLDLLSRYQESPGSTYRDELKRIVHDNFDLEWTTRFVIGRHWREATPQQQAELLTLMPDYAAEIAARAVFAIKASDIDSFRVLDSRPLDGKDGLVTTEVTVKAEPFMVGWRVRDEGRRLRIVDAMIRGVSMALALRQTFDSVIEREGLNGLIAEVRGKLTEMRSEAR